MPLDLEKAESLSLLLLRSAALLNEGANLAQNFDDEESRRAYIRLVGDAMSAIYFNLAEPIWRMHPELRPEQLGGAYRVDPDVYVSGKLRSG